MFNQNKKEKENMAINQLGLALDQFLHERVEDIFNQQGRLNQCKFFHFKTDKYFTAKGLPFVVIQSQLEHNSRSFKETLRIIRKRPLF